MIDAERAERKRQREIEQEVMAKVAELMHVCRMLGSHKAAAVKEMEREHRTNQQTATDFLLSWFGHLADMKQRHATDMRNDEAAKIGMEIVEKVLAPRFGCTAEEFLKQEYHLHRLLLYV
jgi:hypothetical protein